MIQLREDDVLWRLYCRFYKFREPRPAPCTLCNLFWVAMGGLCKALFMDFPVLLFFVLAVPAVLGAVYGDLRRQDDGSATLFFSLYALYSFVAVILLSGRVIVYLESCRETVKNYAGFIVFVVVFSLLFSIPFRHVDGSWNLWCLLFGFLSLLGLAALVVGIVFFCSTRLWDMLVALLKAGKNRVCPLVKAPGQEQYIEHDPLDQTTGG